jgi:phosphatidylserine/phosphatidylglycerophosphate/cardiolipin synthase-like enzyme
VCFRTLYLISFRPLGKPHFDQRADIASLRAADREHRRSREIDGRVVITGSFNLTKAADESDAENLLVIRDEEPAASLIPTA